MQYHRTRQWLGCAVSMIFGVGLWSLGGTARAGDDCSVRDKGATGTGFSLDTAAIQAAIDDCARRLNGGKVVFPPGTYL